MTSPFASPEGPPVAGQDYWLVDEYSTRPRLDPDPLDLTHHPAYVLGYEHGWADAPLERRSRRPPLDRLVVSFALAVVLLVGIAIGRVSAASWPGPQTTERVDVVRALSAGDRTTAPIGVWVVRR